MKKLLLVLCGVVIAFIHCVATNRTWIGKGSVTGGTGTDFNTAANWSPSGVPVAVDNLTIAIISDATITLSASLTINNLTYSVTNNNTYVTIDVGNFNLTVNGTSSIQALGGNSNTTAEIGTTNSGTIDFKGNVDFGTNVVASGAGPVFIGNPASKIIFRGDLTLGRQAALYSGIPNVPGTIEFDGSGLQTITWNCNKWACNFNNVNIGNTNNPVVTQVTGLVSPYDLLGNITVNGSSTLDLGASQWNRSSSGGSLTLNSSSKLKLGAGSGGQSGSNFPLNFSTLTLNAASTVEYNSSTSGQTIYDVPSPGYGSLTLTNNSTKTAGGSLDIRGNLTINSTSTFSAGNSLTHNISGNWTNNGAFTYSTASTIVLKGSAQQLISGTAIFNNLTINNTANNAAGDILLNNTNMTITGTCTFTDGIINSSTGNLVIFNINALASGANNASFVNVPVRKIGNNAFTFPVGKLNVGYMRCGISAPGNATDAFTAEYKRASATALGPVTAPGLYRVSGCEYWQIDRTTGSSNVNVTLSWSGLSPCNAAAYVTNLSFLTVAHFNGTSWDTHAVTSYTGNASSGTITRNGVSVFSPFSIGSTSATTNPLPIKFADVKAYSVNNGNKIEWTNMTEENIARYEVERSGNGISFTSILTADPKTNNGQENKYAETDGNILAGINYYRVKAVQSDGSYLYSTIVKVSSSASTERNISVYPNPVIGTQFTLQLNNYKSGSYSLLLLNGNGQQVMTKTIQHRGGTISVSVEKPETILPGVYILQLKGDNSIDNMKLVIR